MVPGKGWYVCTEKQMRYSCQRRKPIASPQGRRVIAHTNPVSLHLPQLAALATPGQFPSLAARSKRSLDLQQASRVAEQVSRGGQSWPGCGSMLMRSCQFLSLLVLVVKLACSGAGPVAGPKGGAGMGVSSAGLGARTLPTSPSFLWQQLQHSCSPQGCSSFGVSAACSNLIRTRPCRTGLHEMMALRGSEQHDSSKPAHRRKCHAAWKECSRACPAHGSIGARQGRPHGCTCRQQEPGLGLFLRQSRGFPRHHDYPLPCCQYQAVGHPYSGMER